MIPVTRAGVVGAISVWAAFFRDNGGFAAIAQPIGNYNAPYLYFLAAISYLPVPDLYCIKLFSILFDVLLAWGGGRLARCLTGEGDARPYLAFFLLLLLPTPILNGAYWRLVPPILCISVSVLGFMLLSYYGEGPVRIRDRKEKVNAGN